MAKRLASEIGYRYIDSGAMYRAVTLFALRNGMIKDDGSLDKESLIKSLPEIKIDFKPEKTGQKTLLNGEDVEDEIRGLRVSNHVSPIAAIPEIRHALVDMQRMMGKDKGIVMDGRDIGSVVFPGAEMKIFCNASPERRAERRYKELLEKGKGEKYEDVLKNIQERDLIDTTRKESPLVRPQDAILLDNSDMTLEEQDKFLLDTFSNIMNNIQG